VSGLSLYSVNKIHDSLWAVYDEEDMEVVSHEDKGTDPNGIVINDN
jgi:hypothetical protein